MNSLRKRSTRIECEALEDRVTPATLTWLGAVNGVWSNPGNWGTTDQTHTVPYDGADLVFPATAGNLTQIDDLPALSLSTITFLGGGYGYANWLGPIDAVVVLAGVGTAFYFKKYRPEKYEQAGRLINEGL